MKFRIEIENDIEDMENVRNILREIGFNPKVDNLDDTIIEIDDLFQLIKIGERFNNAMTITPSDIARNYYDSHLLVIDDRFIFEGEMGNEK